MSDKIKDVKQYYDVTAGEWAQQWYANEMMLPFLQKFISLLPDKPRVLDAGCGAGYESMRLFRLGADVVGVDISEKSIEIARSKNPDCRFEIINCKMLDKKLGTFDGIVSIALIVHIEGDDLQLIFDNFKRVIKSAGFLFVAFVEGDGFCEKRSFIEIDGEKYNRSFYLHKPERIIETAKVAGFKYYEEWFLEKPLGEWKFLVFRAL